MHSPAKTGTKSRKAEIIRRATVLFRRNGYAGASMRDLARDSGIEAASLYSHFKSKEDILQKICFAMADAYMQGIGTALKDEGAHQKLKTVIKEHSKVSLRHMDAAAVMWNEWKHMTDPYRKDFVEMIRSYENRFTEILVEGCEEGVFEIDKVAVAANIMLSAMNGLIHWYDPEKHDHEHVTKTLTVFALRGIIK